PTLGDRMLLGKGWRREILRALLREIHLQFNRFVTVLSKCLARRETILPLGKLHQSCGGEERRSRITKAHETTVGRHGLVLGARVAFALTVLREKFDKIFEQLFLVLRHNLLLP